MDEIKTPSDEDFKRVRRWLDSSVLHPAFDRTIRYLLAEHDAKPSLVAVPEDVVREAREVVADPLGYADRAVRFARAILSLVPKPEPVVEWRKDEDEDGNTRWTVTGSRGPVRVQHILFADEPMWCVEGEPYTDLAAAKSRAEELCGVAKTKGG